jgi:hypothetical protein
MSDGTVVDVSGFPRNTQLKNGYLEFSIRLGITRKVKVHVLAAYQKFGEACFQEGILVRHLNGVSTDNSLDNIAIGTASDNMMDLPPQARLARARHAATKLRSLTPEQVLELRKRFAAGEKLQTLATEFGVAKSTASYAINKKTYSYL